MLAPVLNSAWAARFALLMVVSSAAPRLWADEIHVVSQKITASTDNQHQTVVQFAVGTKPDAENDWPEQRLITLTLPGKEGEKGAPNFLTNGDASIAVLNYRPLTKRRGAYLMLSPKPRTVCVVTDLSERIAALCAGESKAVNENDVRIERIEGNLLTVLSETQNGDRYTITLRALPGSAVDKIVPGLETPPSTAVAVDVDKTKPLIALQIVKYSQTKVSVAPSTALLKTP